MIVEAMWKVLFFLYDILEGIEKKKKKKKENI